MTRTPFFDPGPVIGVRIYRSDVVVVREGIQANGHPDTNSKRKEITMFSKASRKRLAFIVNNTRVHFSSMITLTYPLDFPSDGQTVKKHLNTFLIWAIRRFKSPSYVWFLEFQKRGAPHVHILLCSPLPVIEEQRKKLFADVSERWYAIVGSNDPKHLAAGTRCERIRKPDGAARYALKYCYKMEQKCVPQAYRNVGRFWGTSRDVPPSEPRLIPMDEPSIRAVLADWDYCPDKDTLVYQTLFGCADRFNQYSGIRVFLTLTN